MMLLDRWLVDPVLLVRAQCSLPDGVALPHVDLA